MSFTKRGEGDLRRKWGAAFECFMSASKTPYEAAAVGEAERDAVSGRRGSSSDEGRGRRGVRRLSSSSSSSWTSPPPTRPGRRGEKRNRREEALALKTAEIIEEEERKKRGGGRGGLEGGEGSLLPSKEREKSRTAVSTFSRE